MRRGILGGTFDPPHLGHLLAGETAYRQLGLDVVSFIPAGAPWQKAGRPLSPAHHRLAMTTLAVDEVEYFEVDAREVERPGSTYTIDTLEAFDGSEQLILILGADAAAGLSTWQRADAVAERAEIAVAPRAGASIGALTPRMIELDMPMVDVSGTGLRARAAAGGSLRFLVPDPVWLYLTEHRLYD